ncbi:MAG: tRNA pseudouridine(38-40) synthase TruA [Acidobacteria bacterium]|nr:tRNA pseudouridine(38-40) synthase TruA [Acidobacteriota bacterium]
MRTLKLTVAYDGTNYVGWQRQVNGISVQQMIEDAFAPLAGTTPGPGVAGAGRTDAGVHAAAQVASVNVDFDHPADAVLRALNVRLPPDIRVMSVEEAPLGFHARFHARGKAYRYRVVTTSILSPFDRLFVSHAPGTRDVDAMREGARLLVGRHDFASFQARGSAPQHTVRDIERLDVDARPDEIVFDITGNGFLRHMARTLVGTLMEVGEGLRPPASMRAVLAARDRRAAGRTMPASGLTLMAVRYR